MTCPEVSHRQWESCIRACGTCQCTVLHLRLLGTQNAECSPSWFGLRHLTSYRIHFVSFSSSRIGLGQDGEDIQTYPRGHTLPFHCGALAPSGLCQTKPLCQATIDYLETSGEE